MSFVKRPQPPFKRFVKTKRGVILEPNYHTAKIEPATFSKKTGLPLFQYGWEIVYRGHMVNKQGDCLGEVEVCDLIVATADTREELE